jgi:hypothetical protein
MRGELAERLAEAGLERFAALVVYDFSSLGCNFDLDQLLCTRPGQMVVERGSPGRCCPAALFQVIALFPARGDLLQGCQVRFRIAVLQEFLHADRRERCHDSGIGPLGRKLVSSAAGHPAAHENPMTIDATAPIAIPCRRRVRDSPRRIDGTCMAFSLSMRRTCAARPHAQLRRRMLITPPNTALFAGYCAYRRHRCCPK